MSLMEAINRKRTISLYCMLTGRYAEFCDKCKVYRNECGRVVPYSERDNAEILAFITPDVERFCGDWFSDGKNPDAPPHPIAIAIDIRHGRSSIRDTLAKLGCPGELNRVWELMKAHGMTVEKEKK
jgi:hypothetical protein